MSMHDDLQAEQPQKRGMSSTAKVLLVLGSITGVCMLTCCGVVGVGFLKFKDVIQEGIKNVADATSSDPAVVKKRTAEVIEIDIPDEFTPVMMVGGGFGEFSMKEFIYTHKANPNSVLVIVESNQPLQPGQSAQQQREAMIQGVRQGQQFSLDMQEESRETRDFTINGEDVPFEFIKGKAHGVPTRKVVGVFSSRQGTIMLMLLVAESDYTDEKIVAMIQSIKLPVAAAPAVSDQADESTDKTPENAEEMDDETELSSEPASP